MSDDRRKRGVVLSQVANLLFTILLAVVFFLTGCTTDRPAPQPGEVTMPPFGYLKRCVENPELPECP